MTSARDTCASSHCAGSRTACLQTQLLHCGAAWYGGEAVAGPALEPGSSLVNERADLRQGTPQHHSTTPACRTCGAASHHDKVQRCTHVLLTGAWQRCQLKLVLDALSQSHAVSNFLQNTHVHTCRRSTIANSRQQQLYGTLGCANACSGFVSRDLHLHVTGTSLAPIRKY